MSLLASRTHQWEAWALAEVGRGPIEPGNVYRVDFSLQQAGIFKQLKATELGATAIDLWEAIQDASPGDHAQLLPPEPQWQTVKLTDGFLSEIDTSKFPKTSAGDEWILLRGSVRLPTLFVKTR